MIIYNPGDYYMNFIVKALFVRFGLKIDPINNSMLNCCSISTLWIHYMRIALFSVTRNIKLFFEDIKLIH